MHKFVRNLLTEWRRLGLPVADETFLIAVSGGADSMSLAIALGELRRLKKLNLRFVVAHFNHDLRQGESDEDELFVRSFAERFEFELACGKPANPNSKIQNKKGNLEQNARLARYDFLFETARNSRAHGVLTAHTLNDQAETFLLNLIRGSGLEGLGGMKTVRNAESGMRSAESLNADCGLRNEEFEDDSPSVREESDEVKNYEFDAENSAFRIPHSAFKLVRPLLDWATRERTENFCLENQIAFRFDSMNENLAYRRVRIRKVLLPMLADFNPKIVETLAKTARLLREDYDELKFAAGAAAEKFQAKKTGGENSLQLSELKNLFPSMRRQILREWLKNCRGGSLRGVDSKHLAAIESLIASRKSGRRVELPGGARVTKSGGRLRFEKTEVEKTLSDNYNQGLDSGGAAGAIGNND